MSFTHQTDVCFCSVRVRACVFIIYFCVANVVFVFTPLMLFSVCLFVLVLFVCFLLLIYSFYFLDMAHTKLRPSMSNLLATFEVL